MSERLRPKPEILTPNMDPANERMHSLLDLYGPKRRPLALEDYNLDAIQPDLIDPDVRQCLRFVAEVESNPEGPAEHLLKGADKGGATWQRRFVEDIWLPEERMHGVLLRECAIRYGAPQQLIDEEIEQVRAREFKIGNGYSSLKADVYGWLQEATTWRFYQAMQSATLDPILKNILNDIAKQENFHRHVYLEGAKVTLEHNPTSSKEVVEAVAEFIMPGHDMVPDLQPHAPRWAKKFNFQFGTEQRDRVDGLVDLIGHEGLGEATIAYLAENDNAPWYLKIPFIPLNKLHSSRTYHLFGKFADAYTKKR